MKTKVQIHGELCDKMHSVYEAKNHDYGDSFSKLRQKYPNAILVRLNDKLSRLEVLMSGEDAQVKSESINDTLLDLANYAIMELTEREAEKQGGPATHEEWPRQVGEYILKNLGISENDDGARILVDKSKTGDLTIRRINAVQAVEIRHGETHCDHWRNGGCMGQKGEPECTPGTGYCPRRF